MRVFVVNAGSSSLKLRLLDSDQRLLFSEDLTAHEGRFELERVREVLSRLGDDIEAVGHRVVHGGTLFTGPVVLSDTVEDGLRGLSGLAPLHQKHSLTGITIMRELLPKVPAVACFDTAFHATLAEGASTYAVPLDWRTRLGVRRFGFHGLSHAYASRRAAAMVGRPLELLRIATCHLGAGASIAAVREGRSVDTTMGFTPLEGLVMATRSGTVDPGLITWLIEHVGMTSRQVGQALEEESGLLALAGISDMSTIERRADAGDDRAQLAVAVYVHRLKTGIAAMTGAMGGIDVLVFTGGVGENAASIRAAVASGLAFLGVNIDAHANSSATPDADVTATGSRVATLVIEAREDLQIASEVRSVLA